MIRKTAAVTAASIAGVMLAGTVAVGANIGILNAADDNSGLGTLSANAAIAAPAEPSTTTAPSTTVPPSAAMPSDASDDEKVQTFAVDAAGTVDIETDDSGLHVKAVHANDGWTWKETTSGPRALALVFTSGGDTLEFHAELNDDGSIVARVDQPIVTQAPARTPSPSPATNSTGSYDDDDEYEHDDDHEDDDDHEEDEHEEHEHEGGEDDD